VPPVAVTVVDGYAMPTVPAGNEAGPLTATAGLILNE
jgi:hypothetical protein